MAFIRKNKGAVSHVNQIWIKKNLTCIILTKKLILYCLVFEINDYICRNDYQRGCWL